MDNIEYVPRTKRMKTKGDIGNGTPKAKEDPAHLQHIINKNKNLRARFPEEYEKYKEELKQEMKEELDEYYQKKTRKNLEELEQFYEEKLRVKKEKITMSLKQDFEDEVKKMVEKMRIEFQRRKEKERFDRYERIKREIVEAKKMGKKVCLACGAEDASYRCRCQDTFYCNQACLQEHSWIHSKYCTGS